jgi:hypothetical protein
MFSRIRTYGSFVRFSHSVFALPFALVGGLLGMRAGGFDWSRVVWIVACMVSARSAAMGFNRVVDARIDATNPRTAMRELPAGRSARGLAVVIVSSARCCTAPITAVSVSRCRPSRCDRVLAPRQTRDVATQAFLGLAMAVAPIGGWLAVGDRRQEPLPLGLGDRTQSVASTCFMPARISTRSALGTTRPTWFGTVRSPRSRAATCHRDCTGCSRRAAVTDPGTPRVGRFSVADVEQSSSAPDLSQVKRSMPNGWSVCARRPRPLRVLG